MIKPDFVNDLDYRLLKEKYDEEELVFILDKIKNDYPVQYAIGDVDFLKNKILVDERVLVPRFETELLVSKLSQYIKMYGLEKVRAIDICTGSGCIAIALKTDFCEMEVKGIDISIEALEVAKENAKVNEVEVEFEIKDILKETMNGEFSILVSNPPYVKFDEEVSPNTKYEPSIALYPGEDDLLFYKTILDKSRSFLEEKNLIAFEIGSTQGDDVSKYARKCYPYAKIVVEKDFNGLDRFVFIFNNLLNN